MNVQAVPRTSALDRAWKAALYAFAVGMLLVERFDWLANPNRLVGLVVAGLGLVVVSRRRQASPPEVALFGLFIVWSTATGLAVAAYQEPMLASVRLLVQLWALAMGVAAYAWRRGSADDVFRAIWLAALIAAGYLLLGGSAAAAGKGGRASSLLSNPNTLGFVALWGVVSAAWLWPAVKGRRLHRLLLLGSVPAFVIALVLSASRKSFITLLLFGFGWFVLAHVRGSRGKAAKLAGAVIVLAFGYLITGVLLPESTLAHRLQVAEQDPRLSSDRLMLYERGSDLFMSSPITGVGLANYQYLSGTGQYAHSDAAEVLATTGLVGFVLYFSVYAVMMQRAWWLARRVEATADKYRLGMCVVIVGADTVLGLGAPMFLMPYHWMMIGAMAGMFVRWQQQVRLSTGRARIAAATELPPRGPRFPRPRPGRGL